VIVRHHLFKGRTNKTAALDPAPTDPSWPIPAADRVNVRESLFAEAFNGLLQQNLPAGEANKPFAGSVLHSMRRTSLPPAHGRARERSAGLTLKNAISERSPFFRHTLKRRCGICGTQFQRLIAYSEIKIIRRIAIDAYA
jgi:hypothetical protein